MKNLEKIPLILVCLVAFLAPIIGGYVTNTVGEIPPTISVLTSLWSGDVAPLLSHAYLAILLTAAVALQYGFRKVTMLPNWKAIPLILGFFALLVVSLFPSSFPTLSLQTLSAWLAYGVAFFAGIACLGRIDGPKWLMLCLVLGCLVAAILGVQEYGQMRSIDPTWRIFGPWINPNALAAMLIVGFFPALALTLTPHPGEHGRIITLVGALSSVVIAFAIVLTQSKGVFLAIGAGLFLFVSFLAAWNGVKSLAKPLGSLALCAILVGGLMFALEASQSKPGQNSPGVLSRVASAESTQEQSAGFRSLLWKSTLTMIRERPYGFGIGTYGVESGRTGTVSQTQLAHNSLLQMAVESTPLAAATYVGLLGLWLFNAFRGAKKLSQSQNILRAGAVAAVLALHGHALVDSDLSYFGIGISISLLMAASVLLAADGSGPELLPANFRFVSIAAAVGPALMLGYFGVVDFEKGRLRYEISQKNVQEVRTRASEIVKLAPRDGEAWYLKSAIASSAAESVQDFAQAVTFDPRTKYLRSYARALAENGDPSRAISQLQLALTRDPSNLRTLSQLRRLYLEIGDQDRSNGTAQKLVELETSTSFTVRSEPDLIATDTFEARIQLAEGKNPAEAVELLKPALYGYINYAKRTVPKVVQMAAGGQDYSGETIAGAEAKIATGESVMNTLDSYGVEIAEARLAFAAARAALAAK